MGDNLDKQQEIADLIQGTVEDQSDRVAVCIKGRFGPYPATLEAFMTHWPFGVMYSLETKDSSSSSLSEVEVDPGENAAKISISPRVNRGIFSIVGRLIFFEGKGMPTKSRQLESKMIFSYDNALVAQRFLRYPGVEEILLSLERDVKFSELIIRTDVGVYLAQGNSFNSLDRDVCLVTFKRLAELNDVLVESFT